MELTGVGEARRRHRIYRDGDKLGEIEFSGGILWAIRTNSRERVMCECAVDAVWWVSTANPSSAEEYLQYHPLEQMKPHQWGQLFATQELVAA